MTVSFSHVGVCVSDLEQSVRFYVDGLGFEAAESWTIGSEYGALMELPDVELTSQFLRRDGSSIELLHYRSPGVIGTAERRPVNQLGLTHLCFRVDDVDALAARLAGGVDVELVVRAGRLDAELDLGRLVGVGLVADRAPVGLTSPHSPFPGDTHVNFR